MAEADIAKIGIGLTRQDTAKAWLAMYLDSHINDLRLEGKFDQADIVRRVCLLVFGIPRGQNTMAELRAFVEGYRKWRNMPDANLVELEMF